MIRISSPGIANRAARKRHSIISVPGVGASVLCSIALSGCATSPRCPPVVPPAAAQAPQYERVDWAELPGWGTDTVKEAWPAFLRSCRDLRFRPGWSEVCAAAQSISPDAAAADFRGYFQQNFAAYRLRKGRAVERSTGLVTGYYEPLLRGARAPSAEFNTALYSPPPDLLEVDLSALYPELKGKAVRGRLVDGNRVVPYYTRAELPADPALHGRELLWVDNPLDAFTLEIQGSGRVQLAGGDTIRLQYADQNGQPYGSIGRYLVAQGLLTVEQATMPGIRAWLVANPERIQEVLDANPSVVFFKEVPLGNPDEGPKGAEGVALTPGRSIAVDTAYIPLGAPVFLATTFPASDTPLERLVIAQDTGGAIHGEERADFFWGTGDEAREMAGKMRQRGELWLLWPRALQVPQPRR
jgi:membrane-bound lytic murein transglycosylase A